MKRIRNTLIKIIIAILVIIGIYSIYSDKNANMNNTTKNDINQNQDLLEIYYLDVGEADATYIHYKDYHFLIDAGNTVDGKNIVKFLKELGVDYLDIVFATHAHEDHIGGMNWIIYKIPVKEFYIPNHPAEWKSYQNMINALEEKEIIPKEPQINQIFTYDDLTIQVLWVGHDKEDYNENSIVLKINYKNTNYLFMGDAEESVEKELLEKDIKSNVLRAGHHGSKHSTTAQFLYKVHPEYAIISVGKDNDYGHPHQVTIDKLNALNTTIYRTDINHTIHLKSDGEAIKFEFINKNLNGGDLKN